MFHRGKFPCYLHLLRKVNVKEAIKCQSQSFLARSHYKAFSVRFAQSNVLLVFAIMLDLDRDGDFQNVESVYFENDR